MPVINPPRHIVWSTDQVDLSDSFQRRWYLRQVLVYGRAEDIRLLDLKEIKVEIDGLNLPPEIFSLWKSFLEKIDA